MRGLIEYEDRPVSFTMEGGSPDQRVEPIALDLAKSQLRFGSTTEDDLLNLWIGAARMHFEEKTGRQLVNAVWEYALDAFPGDHQIELPRPPLVSVSSIVYDDTDGNEQTLDPATYRVLPSILLEGSPESGVNDPYCRCGRVELAYGESWPATRAQSRAVRIRRTCGYGATAADVPEAVRTALFFLVGHFHRFRSEGSETSVTTVPLGAESLLKPFRQTAVRQLDLPSRWA